MSTYSPQFQSEKFTPLKTPTTISAFKTPTTTTSTFKTPVSNNLESLNYDVVCTINEYYTCMQDPLGNYLLVQIRNHGILNECTVSTVPHKLEFMKDAIPLVNGVAFVTPSGTKIVNYVNGEHIESTIKYSNRLIMVLPVLTISQIQSNVDHAIQVTEQVTANITNRVNEEYKANVEKLALRDLVPVLEDASSIVMSDSSAHREVAAVYYNKYLDPVKRRELMNKIGDYNNDVYRMMHVSNRIAEAIKILDEVDIELVKINKTFV